MAPMNYRATMVFRLRVLLVVYAALCGSASAHDDETSKKAAFDLLDRAVKLAQHFNPEERADTLFGAADVAAGLDAQRANAWSKEAFDLTRQMPEIQSRVPRQKNALRVLAVNDPDTALALYRQQDVLKPNEYPEDPRALSIPSIFSVVWASKGQPYLSQLRGLAVYLGQTGQYPYRAMTDIALEVAESDRKRARHILGDATRAFRRDPGFASSDGEFVEFIVKTRVIPSRSALRDELQAAVESLQRPDASPHSKWRIGVTTPVGNAEFDSESEYLLFRLLPLAKTGDPSLAERLLKTHPALSNAPHIGVDTPVQRAGAMSVAGTASEERMRLALDRSRVFHVSQIAESDPAQARALAEQIENQNLRVMAFALLARAYVRIDPRQAQVWLDDAERSLDSIKDDKTKLGLMTVLVRSNDLMRQEQATRTQLAAALALAEKVYSEDRRQHPERPVYAVQGADALYELAYEAARLEGRQEAESRISKLGDMPLRASLFISAARALAGVPAGPFSPIGLKIQVLPIKIWRVVNEGRRFFTQTLAVGC